MENPSENQPKNIGIDLCLQYTVPLLVKLEAAETEVDGTGCGVGSQQSI